MLLSALATMACDPACEDLDGDGLGAHCALGPDCDDANAARGEDCDAVPPPDCDLDPTSTGCPCLAGTLANCFPGPRELLGVGECVGGRARCVSGHFGLCVGALGPGYEACDGYDQDCDGLSDEGVLSPCGGCDRACRGAVWGGPASPFDASGASPSGGLELTERGELTLTRHSESTGTVWVPSSADATVSRIDEGTLTEVARYLTGALEPSRVAIDAEGDAWIATRAFDGQSTVIEIAGSAARCIDTDGDRMIRTSSGASDVLPFGADECVLRSLDVGAPREVARALAIDPDRGLDEISGGDVWVGLHDGQAFEELDGATGMLRQRVETPGFAPYAAAFDPWGTLWAISRDGQLTRIDPRSTPPVVTTFEVPIPCWLLYSLAIDRDGLLLLTGFSCDRATLYDPTTGSFTTLATEPSPRGVTVGGDGAAFYLAHTGGMVSTLSLTPLAIGRTFDLGGPSSTPTETIGIGVGRYVWAISREAGPYEPGLATALDPVTGAWVGEVRVGFAPHTQGDLTGIQRFEVAAEASLSRVFTGCPEQTRWVRAHIDADLGSRGRVLLEARHAATEAELSALPFVALGTLGAEPPEPPPPYTLALPEGGVLELRVTLSAGAAFGGPRLRRVGVEWTCPGPD